MVLLFTALAPVFIILVYIYFRDKYEKEPIRILVSGFIAGALITIPIIFIEQFLSNYWQTKYSDVVPSLGSAAYSAFIVAAFTEEIFKYVALFFLIWRNKHFNEPFDGIVYATFISLGFAAVENLLYVLGNGLPTALIRAFTAVPAHTIFGISMGYYFALAKFYPQNQTSNILKAIIVPIILHGIYDFLLMSGNNLLLLLFIPYIIFLFIIAFKKLQIAAKKNVLIETKLNNSEYEN